MNDTSEVHENKPASQSNSSATVAVTNEGQRLLREVADSNQAIADRVGASKSLAGHWRTGFKLPGADVRQRLEDAYGIPTGSWDRKVGHPVAPPAALATRPTQVIRDATNISSKAEVISLLDVIDHRCRDSGLSPRDEGMYLELKRKTLRDLRDFEFEEAMADERLAQHQRFRMFVDTVIKCAEPFPDALDAIMAGISELGLG